MSKIQKQPNLKIFLLGIGILLMCASPLVWVIVPQLFSDALCNPGPNGNGCGYANVGLNAYGFAFAALTLIAGIVLAVSSTFISLNVGAKNVKSQRSQSIFSKYAPFMVLITLLFAGVIILTDSLNIPIILLVFISWFAFTLWAWSGVNSKGIPATLILMLRCALISLSVAVTFGAVTALGTFIFHF